MNKYELFDLEHDISEEPDIVQRRVMYGVAYDRLPYREWLRLGERLRERLK